jgi:hypothetical protein
VLEQRIARVHRLGQRETVQVVLLVAADAYEERVMRLVHGKRELFDNVVSDEATADVVGVSRKLLDVLAEELAGGPESPPAAPAAAGAVSGDLPPPAEAVVESGSEVETSAPAGAVTPTQPEAVTDPSLASAITALQDAFAARLERILGTAGGLLVVLDRVTEDDERTAERLSSEVPIAVIDPLALRSLRRIGAGGLGGETRTYLNASLAGGPAGGASPLLALARERLAAAEILVAQGAGGSATELLASALLAGAAQRAGLERAPAAEQAVVWLHGDAVPRGWLSEADAGLVTRALALQQAPQVPGKLVEGLLTDVRAFLGAA